MLPEMKHIFGPWTNRLTVAALCLLVTVGTASAQAYAPRPGSYDAYNYQGNLAAQRGDFQTAIADWTKAIRLDRNPTPGCRGEMNRVDIRAARLTQQAIRQRKVSAAAAPAYYQSLWTKMWMANRCDLP